MKLVIEIAPENVGEFFQQLAAAMAPEVLKFSGQSKALLGTSDIARELKISPDQARALVNAGFIDRVPGFTEIKVSPEAMAKYRNSTASK